MSNTLSFSISSAMNFSLVTFIASSISVVHAMPQDIYNYAEQEYGQEIDRGFGSSNDVAPISENDLMVVHQLEGMNRPREQWGSSRRTLGLLGMNNNQPMSMVMGNGNSAMGAMTSSERRPRRNRGRNGLVGRVLGRRGNGESGWDVYRICSLGFRRSRDDRL